MRDPSVLTLLITMVLSCVSYAEKPVRAAVASNFVAPMKAITQAFEQAQATQVVLTFGSSGKFVAQIKNGAPFDVFFSADQTRPAALEQAGFVVPGSRFTYAVGSLVLWSGNRQIKAPFPRLVAADLTRVAVANPRVAPYGAAALETLKTMGLYTRLKGKLVFGENIAQTYAFVSSGNAELGFVARSQVIDAAAGSTWPIPPAMHKPIRQDAVLLKKGRENPSAGAFLDFVRSDEARGIMATFAYETTGN